jgi:phage tail protein X
MLLEACWRHVGGMMEAVLEAVLEACWRGVGSCVEGVLVV